MVWIIWNDTYCWICFNHWIHVNLFGTVWICLRLNLLGIAWIWLGLFVYELDYLNFLGLFEFIGDCLKLFETVWICLESLNLVWPFELFWYCFVYTFILSPQIIYNCLRFFGFWTWKPRPLLTAMNLIGNLNHFKSCSNFKWSKINSIVPIVFNVDFMYHYLDWNWEPKEQLAIVR